MSCHQGATIHTPAAASPTSWRSAAPPCANRALVVLCKQESVAPPMKCDFCIRLAISKSALSGDLTVPNWCYDAAALMLLAICAMCSMHLPCYLKGHGKRESVSALVPARGRLRLQPGGPGPPPAAQAQQLAHCPGRCHDGCTDGRPEQDLHQAAAGLRRRHQVRGLCAGFSGET